MVEIGTFWLTLAGVLGAAAFAFDHFRSRSGTGRALVYISLLLVCSSALVDGAAKGGGLSAAGGAFYVSLVLWMLLRDEGGETSELYSGPKTRGHLVLGISALIVLWLGLPVQIGLPLVLVWLPLSADFSSRKHWAALVAGVGLAVVVIARAFLSQTAVWDFFAPLKYGFTPDLLGSNLLYFLAGRNVGAVVWYLPFFLLLLCYRTGRLRGWILFGLIAAAVFRLALAPHNFFGGPEAVGSGAFLTLFVGAWYIPRRVPGALFLGATAVASGLFMWPAWVSPVATWRGEDRPALHEYSLASRLPYETTQEFVPYSTEWQGTGVLSRSLGPGLEDSDRGPVLIPDNGPAELMIAGERPLEAVLLDFGPEAKSEIEVEGGEVSNIVFKPDGGVRFEVSFGEPDRKHRMWWGERTHFIYLLDFEMPGAEGALPVAILARPKEALPRSLDADSAELVQPAEPVEPVEPVEPAGIS